LQRDGYLRFFFPVALRFHLKDASYIVPVDSPEFREVDHVQQFLSGSKVAFRRKSMFPGIEYFHTGILLRGQDGQVPFLLEVNNEPGSSNNSNEIFLHAKPIYEVFIRGSNLNNPSISICNEYLEFLGLDMRKILYQYSRIAG
jgi:hypothetical protein